MTVSNMPVGGVHLFQDTLMNGNAAYSLTGRLRIEDLVKAKASVFLYFYDAAYNLLGSQTVAVYTSNREYTTLTNGFTTPAGTVLARVHIRLDVTAAGGGGTIFADSFSVRKGNVEDVLLNGSFEEDTSARSVADHWNPYADAGITNANL